MRALAARGASDIHLIRGLAPVVRINSDIHVSQGKPLDEATLNDLIDKLLLPKQREILQERLQLCFSRQWEGVGRFRASVYFHAGCPELSIRLCETVVRSAAELGLPPVVEELTRIPNGLILVTGPTGTGKTTTLNFMVDVINRNRRAKIVTIEDPVEFVHDNLRSIIVQQEVGTDVRNFREALIHVLRQDPDVIVVGEMRDLETIETALTAAETGHLVLATLHTPDTVQTIQRISSVFPADQQNAIVIQLAAMFAGRVGPEAIAAGRRQGPSAGLRGADRHAARAPSNPRAEGLQPLHRDADRPQAPDADDGLRPVGTLPEGRDHLRRCPVARPRARRHSPSDGRRRALIVSGDLPM